MCFSAKWYNGKQITKGWIDYQNKEKGLLKEVWELLDEADIVIAHNGKQFDIPTLIARFLFYGLKPPSPYRVIDTKQEFKKYTKTGSNKLDDLGDYYGLGRKIEHEGFPLWKACMAGDRNAWQKMKKYNKQDVLLLEKIYLKLRPWISNHPNLSMYLEQTSCPKCGSVMGFNKSGFYTNTSTRYQVYRCKNCRGQARSIVNLREFKPGLQNI